MLVNQVRFEVQADSPKPSAKRDQAVLFAVQIAVTIQKASHLKEMIIDNARVLCESTMLLNAQRIIRRHSILPPD
jgi:hypothetical protein